MTRINNCKGIRHRERKKFLVIEAVSRTMNPYHKEIYFGKRCFGGLTDEPIEFKSSSASKKINKFPYFNLWFSLLNFSKSDC